MSLYTIVFILVTFLILIGLALFGLFVTKLDKWIDRRERLGRESVYKKKTKISKNDSDNETKST
ncbi:MAG: hypothetical protein GYA14_11810 [Ignavibacteria bacterium]|nr:hypothetical protein [Ignavibacteria bacterium]